MHKAIAACCIAAGALSAYVASAQTTCLAYPSGSTPPSGYAASWDIFSSARELLVKVNCPSSGSTLTLSVGKGDTAQLIHDTAWSYTGAWNRHTLSGTAVGTGWLSGSGTATLGAPSSASAANPFFFVGYVCTNRSGTWKCGCENTACTTGRWQLQGYTGRVPVVTPGSCASWKNDIAKNPFNKNSMYHIPLAQGLRYAGDNDPTTLAWKANDFGNFKIGCSETPDTMGVCNSNGHPIFIAPAGTPSATVGKLAADANSLPVTVRMPEEAKINLPQGSGQDGTITIYYPDTKRAYIFYKYSWNSGNPSAQRHVNFPVDGTGHPNRSSDPDVGTPAAGVANWLGIMRGHEAAAIGQDFNHRFKIAVARKDNQGEHILGRGFHLPANGTDGGITADQNRGPFNYGDIVALPPTVNIDSLGLSEVGKRFARAMQQYGLLIADGGPEGIRADQHLSVADRDNLQRDMRVIWDHMRRVEDFTTNAHFDAAVAAGKIGPGAPLGPNCAFDAP